METAPFLRNRYWALRHGKSIPNDRGIIISSMENGVLPEYQLANEGFTQAQMAGELFLTQLKENGIPIDKIRICYSPFSRTTMTAKTAASVLNIPFDGPQCNVMDDLRERYFGPSFELMSHDKYVEIWDLDEQDPFLAPEGGESVDNVASRLADAVERMESEYEGCAILVVSHGDPLQILQTIMHAANRNKEDNCDLASRFRKIRVRDVLSEHRKYAMLTGQLSGDHENS